MNRPEPDAQGGDATGPGAGTPDPALPPAVGGSLGHRLSGRLFWGSWALAFLAVALAATISWRATEAEGEELAAGYAASAKAIRLALAATLQDRIGRAVQDLAAIRPEAEPTAGRAVRDPLPAADGFLTAVLTAGADGLRPLRGSLPTDEALAELAEACAALRGGETTEVATLPPLRDGPQGEWLIPLTRASAFGRGCDGPIALLRSGFVNEFLRTLDIDFAVLTDTDGTILARFPDAQGQTGRSLGRASVFARAWSRRTEGTITSVSPVDGKVRINAYAGLPDLPLVLAVGYLHDRVDAVVADEHERMAINFGALTLALLLACGVGRRFFFGYLESREILHRQHDEFRRRWEFAVEGSRQGVWDWDRPQGRIFISRLGRDLLGYADRAEEMAVEEWFALIHPDDRAAARNALDAFLDGQIAHLEHRMRLRAGDGSWRWLVLRGMALAPSRNGEPQRIVGTFADVTEEEQANLDARLAATVFSQAAEGVVITDDQNRVVKINSAYTRITGYEEAEVLGRNPGFIGAGRQDRAFYQAMWQRLEQQGHWRGEVWNRRKDGTVYAQWLSISVVHDAAGKVVRHVGIFSDITNQKKKEELIERHAYYDALTGLPNRRLLLDRLEQEVLRGAAEGGAFALLFVDLDHFKEINDSLGHVAGDQVLTETARRLESCVRTGDTVARLAGDEFVILTHMDRGPGRDGSGDPVTVSVAQRLIRSLAQPIQCAGQEVQISASVGIACYPTDGEDAATLLASADRAMYLAKEEGRNTFRFHTLHLQQESRERNDMLLRLRRAIRNDEFLLCFQPIYDLRSGRIAEAEALIRWRRPDGTLVPPARFIPIAENSDLIIDIGEWVFRKAVSVLQDLRGSGLAEDGLRLTLNVSPRHLMTRDPVQPWLSHLQQAGVPADALTLEITEGLLLDGNPSTLRKLQAFSDAGMAIAIDDFGTGYSAMSYLKRFPIDYVKIDRSFIHDIEASDHDKAITEAIVVMAGKLGLKTVAEGVETDAQHAMLRDIGCDFGQGFLYARPMLEQEFRVLLAQQQAAA